MFNKIKVYFGETVGELKKVSWPKKEEVLTSTWLVIGFIIIMAILLGVIDSTFGFILNQIFR